VLVRALDRQLRLHRSIPSPLHSTHPWYSLLFCLGWVAAHAIDFYNDISLIWQVMACDPYLAFFKPGEGFPSGVEYRWMTNSDEPAISVSAPDYVNLVLDWIGDQLNDLTKFPDDAENEVKVYSTPQFAVLCGQIFRRLFRIYGIIYCSFFDTIEALGMTPHLNTCFKHFLYFALSLPSCQNAK
jgi:MOB kinase activator 1